MRKIIPIAIVLVLAMLGYDKYQRYQLASEEALAERPDVEEEADEPQPEAEEPRSSRSKSSESFECDGRKRCSQMHSCAEATWFINHCPGMEMDGYNDGVPCERQWCNQS